LTVIQNEKEAFPGRKSFFP